MTIHQICRRMEQRNSAYSIWNRDLYNAYHKSSTSNDCNCHNSCTGIHQPFLRELSTMDICERSNLVWPSYPFNSAHFGHNSGLCELPTCNQNTQDSCTNGTQYFCPSFFIISSPKRSRNLRSDRKINS